MKKETKYICFNCGKRMTYEQLKKRLNQTDLRPTPVLEAYNHSCPHCNNEKFLIVSIVERL